jgi:threonine dehydratase
MIPLDDIRKAALRVEGNVFRTPLLSSRTLGDRAGVDLHLKCECFQRTGSFKARGAMNKVLSLSQKDRAGGLITVSAGNHAQAVAWASSRVGAPCAVVMPTDAPRSKIDAVLGYGAEPILHPDRATLFDKLHEEREARGATFVHPFDDPVVLAGAGTAGLEIVEDLPDVDIVVVPVGGGGLMGGVASAVKGLRSGTHVIAVELEAGPGLGPALAAGRPVTVPRPYGTLADGMTPPFVGMLPMEIARDAEVEVVTVTEDELIETMKLLMTRAKLYVEAAGAAATAALLFGKADLPVGSHVAALVSGGNMDFETMAALIEKGKKQ